jgi:hypothetical protein
MHYELWGIPRDGSANMIRDFDTEAEALVMVRELLANGWEVDELALGLGLGDDDPEHVELPTALHGQALLDALAERAPEPVREGDRILT